MFAEANIPVEGVVPPRLGCWLVRREGLQVLVKASMKHIWAAAHLRLFTFEGRFLPPHSSQQLQLSKPAFLCRPAPLGLGLGLAM